LNPAAFALRRPRTVFAILLGFAAAAWMALARMPRDVFPPLGVPTIYVAQPYGGMDAAQMEGFLTYYYEYHFLYLTGIEHVESRSIQGAAVIKLQFHPGVDMSQAMAETVAYVNRARAFMPPGAVPPFVMRFDAGSVPVGNLVFASDTRSVAEMQDAALNKVRPLFATLPGVSAPPPFGGSARSIVVGLKPGRLQALGLSPDDVVAALAGADTISPSGNLPVDGAYPAVPLNSVPKSIKDLEGVPLRPGAFPPTLLRDVADVTDASDLVTCYALVNGRRTVYIPVTKRADASTLSVVESVKANMGRFQAVLPPDIQVRYEFDQSPFVTRAIRSLAGEAALAACLAGLMILLFLRDLRSVAIVVLSIPLSLVASSVALWVTGQTINLMTLGGLTLAVGILVDEGTVCLENIHANRAAGKRSARAALDATLETNGPRLVSMMCVLAMFLPALFMQGAARALYLPLSLAVGFSLAASYLLSSTLTPILAVQWLPASATAHADPAWFRLLLGAYRRAVGATVRLRWIVIPAYLAALAAVYFGVAPAVGREIFPNVEAGQLQLRLRTPTGSLVERTEAAARRVLAAIRDEVGPDNVAITLGFVGVHAPNYPIDLVYLWNGGPEEGVVQVQFKPSMRIPMAELRERLRTRLRRDVPDVRVAFEPSDIVSRVMSFGANAPIEIDVAGPDLNADAAYAETIRGKLAGLPFLRDLQQVEALDYPSININVDRQQAGLLGVRVADIAKAVTPATSSSRFTTPVYWADPVSGVAYQVQVEAPPGSITNAEALRNTFVNRDKGGPLLLRQVAEVKAGKAPGQYARYNMQRMVTLTANIEGADLGRAAREVSAALAALGPTPPRVSVALRGQVGPMTELFDGLSTGLLAATGVVLLLLAAAFQSATLAVVTASVAPAAIAGAAVAIHLSGATLNLESYMGGIMAVGVAVANAILLVTFAERRRMAGAEAPAAAAEGAAGRLRPILMTSLAMLAGMTPMAAGLGEGGAQTAPLGLAVAGGLAGATIATLLVLPAVFAAVRSRSRRIPPSLDPDDPESAHFQPTPASPPTAAPR
jgi:multidrug efflux pump subunit AcrB